MLHFPLQYLMLLASEPEMPAGSFELNLNFVLALVPKYLILLKNLTGTLPEFDLGPLSNSDRRQWFLAAVVHVARDGLHRTFVGWGIHPLRVHSVIVAFLLEVEVIRGFEVGDLTRGVDAVQRSDCGAFWVFTVGRKFEFSAWVDLKEFCLLIIFAGKFRFRYFSQLCFVAFDIKHGGGRKLRKQRKETHSWNNPVDTQLQLPDILHQNFHTVLQVARTISSILGELKPPDLSHSV